MVEANGKQADAPAEERNTENMTEEEMAEELRKAIEATYGIPIEQTPVSQLHIEEVMAKARQIPMRNLAHEIEAAQEGGRYAIIFDKNENANVYF